MHMVEWKSPMWVFHSRDKSAMRSYARQKKSTKVNVFTAKRSLRMLRLDVFANVKRMEEQKVPGTVGKNRAVWTDKGRVVRRSVMEFDLQFTKWLCKHKLDGYTTPPLPHTRVDKAAEMHSETVVCKATDLSPVSQVPISSV